MPRVSPDYVPTYRLHRASGSAIVTLSMRDYKLGKFGSADSRARYHALISRWITGGRKPLEPVPSAGGKVALTVSAMLDAFALHAAVYYRRADGTPTSEATCIGYAVAPVRALFGSLAAADFTPINLQLARDAMIAKGWVRTRINRDIKRVKLAFSWAVGQSLVPPHVIAALREVKSLKVNRTAARESKRVEPVPIEMIEAVARHCTRPVAAILRLQLLTAARPGELIGLRTIDVDRSGAPWVYRPAQHKNAHRGQGRIIYFGPRSQLILSGFLSAARPDAPLFSPREGNAEAKARDATKGKSRRPEQKPGAKKTPRAIGEKYEIGSYRRALARGADAADRAAKARRREAGEEVAEGVRIIPRFHPHAVRHTAATQLRKRFGIQAAQLLLGHETLQATEIYAETDHAAAAKIAAEIG